MSRYLETPAAQLLVRLKIPPNAITVAGLLITAVAAYLVSQDNLLIGGLVFLLASVMDMLDGAVARLKASKAPSALPWTRWRTVLARPLYCLEQPPCSSAAIATPE